MDLRGDAILKGAGTERLEALRDRQAAPRAQLAWDALLSVQASTCLQTRLSWHLTLSNHHLPPLAFAESG
ncbi:hypothetical protein [Streptomyces platensis]|uniref:hypothetical protein n=1 Tax=Streptomyces platensis TaxID=58346 RepID=UPI0037BA5DC2